jgi:hypothetical protein
LHIPTRDNTLERQNDAELDSLHGKIKSLRSVSALFPRRHSIWPEDHVGDGHLDEGESTVARDCSWWNGQKMRRAPGWQEVG